MSKLRCLIVLLFVLFYSTMSFAFFDPIEYANYLQDIQTAVNAATQTEQQLQAIQYQVQNTGRVTGYQWRDTTQLLDQMNQTTQKGKAISSSMSNVDAQFRQKYPNYSGSSYGQTNYSQAYQNWNASTLDTLRSTLDASSQSLDDSQNESQMIEQLKRQGQSATGRMQVLQVSSELAAENVNQLQELRHIMINQGNAQNAYMAYQVSKDSYDEAGLEKISSNLDTQFPTYQNNPMFGEMPSMP